MESLQTYINETRIKKSLLIGFILEQICASSWNFVTFIFLNKQFWVYLFGLENPAFQFLSMYSILYHFKQVEKYVHFNSPPSFLNLYKKKINIGWTILED